MFRLPVSIAITVGAAVLVVIAPCRAGGSPLQSNFELVQQLKQIQQQLMGEALERRGPSLWWQELGASDRAGPAACLRQALTRAVPRSSRARRAGLPSGACGSMSNCSPECRIANSCSRSPSDCGHSSSTTAAASGA